MKKSLIIHPFLFSVYPVLFLFSYNIEQVSFSEIILPLAIGLGSSLILLLTSGLVFKEHEKAGIVISIFTVLFFLYGHVFTIVQTWPPSGFITQKHFFLGLIWVILFACGATFIIRTRQDLKKLTNVLNIAALSLVLISIINITAYEFKNRDVRYGKNRAMEEYKVDIASEEKLSRFRDIYYIILDAYAHSNTLKEVYNFDNHEFIDFLVDNGFYIASKSRSNYGTTFLSLASSLNIEYINYLSETIGVESADQTIPRSMITTNKVSNFLKSKGYQIVHFNSGWGPTKHNKYADLEIQTGRGNSFIMMLFQTTMLSPWTKSIFGNGARDRILNHFEKLAKIPEIKGPKFVLAHIISPHPPYLFGADGKSVPESKLHLQGKVWLEKDKYKNQLIFINQKVKTLVTEILAKSETAPIIILQADHGTASGMYEPGSGGWNRPTELKLRERLRILNAFYLPMDDRHLLYNSISPVNTFRFIFNHYFGANYQLLEDRSFYSTYQQPYQFTDVSGQVVFD